MTSTIAAEVGGGARFFINGVKTRTRGVDVVANYSLATPANAGTFNFTVAGNYNDLKVLKVPDHYFDA